MFGNSSTLETRQGSPQRLAPTYQLGLLSIMLHYQPFQGSNNVIIFRKIITIIITMIFLTIMSIVKCNILVK